MIYLLIRRVNLFVLFMVFCIVTTNAMAQEEPTTKTFKALRIILPEHSIRFWNRQQYFNHLTKESIPKTAGKTTTYRQNTTTGAAILMLAMDEDGMLKEHGYLYIQDLPGQMNQCRIQLQPTGNGMSRYSITGQVEPRRSRPVFLAGNSRPPLNSV